MCMPEENTHIHPSLRTQTCMMHTRRHTRTSLLNVMGCSKSKDMKESCCSSKVERKEVWEDILSKGLGLAKLDSNIKRLDTGYIASIYSANYNTVIRRPPQHTKIDVDDLFPLGPPCAEGTTFRKLSKFNLGHGRARHGGGSTLSNLTSVEPHLSNGKDDLSTGLNLGKGGEADGEASISWELMKDLDEQGFLPKVESPTKIHPEAASDPLNTPCQAKASHSVCVLKRAVTLPRAKYLTFFDDTEDVVTSKSSAFGLEENVCLVREHDAAYEVGDPNIGKLFNTAHHDGGVFAESGRVHAHRHPCDKSKVEPIPLRASPSTLEGANTHRHACDRSNEALTPLCGSLSALDSESHGEIRPCPRNLQKALSMKYILNDNSLEIEELHSAPDNHTISLLNIFHGRLHNKNDEEVSLSYESDNSSYLSSPEFSSPASLKDWLPSEDRPLMLAADFYQAGNEASIVDAFEASHVLLRPELLPSSRRVFLKYVGGDSSHPLDDDDATPEIIWECSAEAEGVGAATSAIDTLEMLLDGEILCI